MKYKLLALDIDDTLTYKPTEVTEGNIAAVKRAQDAGVFVTVCTGRGYLGSSSIWKALGVEGPVINYGGAMVNDTRNREIIYTTELGKTELDEIFEMGHELNVHTHIYQGDAVIYEYENEFINRYYSFLNLPHICDADVYKKTWHNVPKALYITTGEKADELIPMLQRHFEGRLKVSGSKRGFIEFNRPEANKGSTLHWLADYMGFTQSEVAAAGDNSLDLEMLEWAGLGAAVANASDEAKARSNIIIPDCGDDAVAWLIDNVILKN